MPAGEDRPQPGQRGLRARAIQADPSAGRAPMRSLAGAPEQRRSSTATQAGRVLTAEDGGLLRSAATQARSSSRPTQTGQVFTAEERQFLQSAVIQARAPATFEPQRTVKLPSRAKRAQSPSSTGEPDFAPTTLGARLQCGGMAGSQTSATGALPAVGFAATPSNSLGELLQEWADDDAGDAAVVNTTLVGDDLWQDAAPNRDFWETLELENAAREVAFWGASPGSGAAWGRAASSGVSEVSAARPASDQRRHGGPASNNRRQNPAETSQMIMTDNQIERVKRYRAGGMSWGKISEKTSLSENSLRQGRFAGVFGNDIKRPLHTAPTKKQISDIKNYLGQRKSWTEIAHLTGIPRTTLRRKRVEGYFGSEYGDVKTRQHSKPLTQDQISQVKEELDGGNQNLTEIARLTGTTRRILERRKYEGVFGSRYRDLGRLVTMRGKGKGKGKN